MSVSMSKDINHLLKYHADDERKYASRNALHRYLYAASIISSIFRHKDIAFKLSQYRELILVFIISIYGPDDDTSRASHDIVAQRKINDITTFLIVKKIIERHFVMAS